MLYFIPAWYQQDEWCENEQVWNVRRMHTEFDDTVKQIQLFHRNGACPYRILLLGFTPNFRHFLHRQGVFHAPYLSCFDALQEIRRKRPMVLSFHNLNWPAGIEFIYTPFVVVAMLKGEKYAQIEFGEDGNPIRIALFEQGRICRRNIYDDRGFVSATVLFKKGKPFCQDYLTEDGTWKMRCFASDGHVEINPKCPQYLLQYEGQEQKKPFLKRSYESMEQVIGEVFSEYLNLTEDTDLFCAAMHKRHAGLLQEALSGKKLILSYFSDRYPVKDHPETFDMAEQADYIIVDSRENLKRFQKEKRITVKQIKNISPYDSRVDFGISQQLDVQKILVPVDGVHDMVFQWMIQLFGAYVSEHKNAQIHLFTRQAQRDRCEQLLGDTRRYLAKARLPEGLAAASAQIHGEKDAKDSFPVKFFVEQCVDELEVSKCMREQRLIVDMRKSPELYLQILAISIGVPQIVRTKTEFVEQGKNGIVLKKPGQLGKALDYYLNGLENWNKAMVCAFELGKKYTAEKLVEEWKEVIDFIG